MAPHSSALAWKIPRMEKLGRLQSMRSLRVRHDWATSLSLSLPCIGEGNGNPVQCSCLENPRDGGAWWADIYGVSQSWTWLKQFSSSSSFRFLNARLSFCSSKNGFPGGSDGRASAYNVGNPGSIPGSGRSSGEGSGNLFQYSGLENPVDVGAW